MIDILKRKAYCELKLFEYSEAYHTLEKVENILANNIDESNGEYLEEIEDLKDAVQHKYHGVNELMSKAMTIRGYRNLCDSDLLCRCGYDVDSDGMINLEAIRPKEAPKSRMKMSGNRILLA